MPDSCAAICGIDGMGLIMTAKFMLNIFKKIKIKGSVVFLIAVCAAVAVIFTQGILAWMTVMDSKNNEMGVMQYIFSNHIRENFTEPDPSAPIICGSTVTKENWIYNDGDIPSFVRVKVFPVLTSQDGVVHMEVQFGAELYYEELNTVDWINGGDGYFYYTKSLAPGESTEILFKQVRLDENLIDFDDAVLSVTLLAESVDTYKWNYRNAWWNSNTAINSGDSRYAVDQLLSVLAQ